MPSIKSTNNNHCSHHGGASHNHSSSHHHHHHRVAHHAPEADAEACVADSAQLELYSVNLDRVFIVPRGAISHMPDLPFLRAAAEAEAAALTNGSADSAMSEQQLAVAAAARAQHQHHRLLLCPHFDAARPEASCPAGSKCRYVHAALAHATSHDIHVNFAWNAIEDVTYERLLPGQTLRVAAPNAGNTNDEVPSHLVIKTRAMQSGRRVMTHCAHFYFNRTCNRGGDCYFVHAVSMTEAAVGTTAPVAVGAVERTPAVKPSEVHLWGRTQQRRVAPAPQPAAAATQATAQAPTTTPPPSKAAAKAAKAEAKRARLAAAAAAAVAAAPVPVAVVPPAPAAIEKVVVVVAPAVAPAPAPIEVVTPAWTVPAVAPTVAVPVMAPAVLPPPPPPSYAEMHHAMMPVAVAPQQPSMHPHHHNHFSGPAMPPLMPAPAPVMFQQQPQPVPMPAPMVFELPRFAPMTVPSTPCYAPQQQVQQQQFYSCPQSTMPPQPPVLPYCTTVPVLRPAVLGGCGPLLPEQLPPSSQSFTSSHSSALSEALVGPPLPVEVAAAMPVLVPHASPPRSPMRPAARALPYRANHAGTSHNVYAVQPSSVAPWLLQQNGSSSPNRSGIATRQHTRTSTTINANWCFDAASGSGFVGSSYQYQQHALQPQQCGTTSSATPLCSLAGSGSNFLVTPPPSPCNGMLALTPFAPHSPHSHAMSVLHQSGIQAASINGPMMMGASNSNGNGSSSALQHWIEPGHRGVVVRMRHDPYSMRSSRVETVIVQ